MNLMNLEIVDYERTADNLQMRLDTKEKQYTESLETIENMAEVQKNMEKDIRKCIFILYIIYCIYIYILFMEDLRKYMFYISLD